MNGFNVSISMTWDRQAGILKPTIPQRILTSRLDWNRWGRWCWCWWWWFQWIGYVGNIDTGKLHDLNGNIYGFRRLRFFLQPIHWWLWCWWVLMICMILYISSFLVSIMSQNREWGGTHPSSRPCDDAGGSNGWRDPNTAPWPKVPSELLDGGWKLFWGHGDTLQYSLTLTKLEVNLCLICLDSIYNKYGGFERWGVVQPAQIQVAILPMNLEAATNPNKFQTMTAYYNPFISKTLLPRLAQKHCPRIEKLRYITRSLICFRMNHQYGNIVLKGILS